MSTARSEPFLTFALVTAFDFSCGVPTDFVGRVNFFAASPTGVQPTSATTNAVIETTIGMRFLTEASFSPRHDCADEDRTLQSLRSVKHLVDCLQIKTSIGGAIFPCLLWRQPEGCRYWCRCF